MAVIKGIAMWAFLNKKNEMSDAYQMDVTKLDKKSVQTLKDLGIPVKKDEADPKEDGYKGYYVTLKSAKFAPKVFDAKKKAVPPEVLIGNGSVVKVSTTPYEWKFKGKSGISGNLNAVQVLNLVEYKGGPGGAAEFEEEEGFEFGTDPEDKEAAEFEEEDEEFDEDEVEVDD